MDNVNGVKEPSEPAVLFEDESVLVLNKPVGWLVHHDGRSSDPTIVDWFLARVPDAKGVGEVTLSSSGEVIDRSGVVHRLDRETSGLLVLAKTPAAHIHLKQQFHDRLTQKTYRTFVYGRVHEKWMTIDRPIGRSRKDGRQRSAMQNAAGKLRDAVTKVECIGVGEDAGETFSYLQLQPITGRTHQLRVHLQSIDRPIVGDTLYASKRVAQSHNLGFTRLALHAYSLTCMLPNGEQGHFLAPLPPSFELAAERIAD